MHMHMCMCTCSITTTRISTALSSKTVAPLLESHRCAPVAGQPVALVAAAAAATANDRFCLENREISVMMIRQMSPAMRAESQRTFSTWTCCVLAAIPLGASGWACGEP